MVGKREKIIEYISELPAGAKVSVRALSREMGVSEGTAYKAIKCAEDLHLVETKARVGTVRLAQAKPEEQNGLLLSAEIRRLGLTVLAGKEFTDAVIERVVIGDGSLEQLKNAISGVKGGILCLVGDRPEILFYAASKGIHLVITAGSHPGEALLESAVKHKACVLSAVQDSAFVYGLLSMRDGVSQPPVNSELAKDWMRASPCLYYNDIVADWHSMYRPIFSAFSKCAVVDDDLRICGTVDAIKALTSTPSRKISSIFSAEDDCFTADESTPIAELADQMIARETATAFITHSGTLSGIITANDILRFYRFHPATGSAMPGLRLEMTEKPGNSNRSTYVIQLPETYSASQDELFSALLSAAHLHCSALSDKSHNFESGTFYAQNAATGGDLLVSCDEIRTMESGYVLDVEIYDDTATYARCLLTVTLSEPITNVD